MRVRLDADQSAESRTGAIVQRVLVKQIAGRVWTQVILQRASVEFLLIGGHTNREHVAPRAFAGQSAQAFEASVGAAEMDVQAQSGSFPFDRRRVDLNRERLFVPVLGADVIKF